MLQKRQARYEWLRTQGLQHFEALTLSKMPKYTPYLRNLVEQRKAEWEAFKRLPSNRGKSHSTIRSQFNHHIDRRYQGKHWITLEGLMSKETVWRMLRSFEKPYKREHPEYGKDKKHYPLRSRHRSPTRTHHKLKQAIHEDTAAELRYAIKHYNGRESDREYLIGVWQKKLDELEHKG